MSTALEEVLVVGPRRGSRLRHPRGLIKVNGVTMPGWVSWEVDTNTNFRADEFRCVFAMSGLPIANGVTWWAAQTEIKIEIFAGFPADWNSYTDVDLDSLILGRADEVAFHFDEMKIEITGRDLTAVLIDTKSTIKYTNQTPAQIAGTLAAKYGLTPVITSNKGKVAGSYYQIDHVKLQDDRTEWELLSYLARESGNIVYVKGMELHFEPAPTATQAPFIVQWTPPTADTPVPVGGFTRLKITRNLTVAKDVTVTVKSWNHKQKKGFVVKASRANGHSASVQQYSYSLPGRTVEEAQRWANLKLAELSQHEVTLTMEGPADSGLQRTDIIQVQGTGSALDQVFFPDTITRSMDANDYTQTVTAKNHNPESQASI
jgi:phage protein D